MANLFDLKSGKLLAFVGKLAELGVTAEMVEECLTNPAAAERRVEGFKNPPTLTAEASSEPPIPVLLWRPVNETTIEVNLDAFPNLPFGSAQLDWKTDGQTGWVKVELRDGKLYVADREVVLHLTPNQKSGVVSGHSIRKSLKGKVVLDPNILDALFENQHLIPESWKMNEHGETLFIYFWAQGFHKPSNRLCVRFLRWEGGQWRRGCDWLDFSWRRRNPAAILAN